MQIEPAHERGFRLLLTGHHKVELESGVNLEVLLAVLKGEKAANVQVFEIEFPYSRCSLVSMKAMRRDERYVAIYPSKLCEPFDEKSC
jgi:hypothetical protein